MQADGVAIPEMIAIQSNTGIEFDLQGKNEEAKAIMLSVWDSNAQETLKIDLWTKDMPVDEMKLFFHQTLVTMSDTFLRATQDEKMTATMRDFCDYFAEKLELKK